MRSLSAHPTLQPKCFEPKFRKSRKEKGKGRKEEATHPVDDENLSINVQAGVACEEHSGSGKVFWSSPTTSGDPLGYLAEAHWIGEEAFIPSEREAQG